MRSWCWHFARWRCVCAFAVATALDQHPIVGPDPASWFRRIGWDVTYGVPLAMIALTLVGHAIRDRSSGLAFSAGLLANVVATIVVLMRLARGGSGLDATAWVTIAQVNAIVAGWWRSPGLAAVRWSRSREPVLVARRRLPWRPRFAAPSCCRRRFGWPTAGQR